jgi:hypothetical protein
MQLLLSVLCDEARPDGMGRLDISGIFNELYAPGFPAKQERMVLVLVIEWDRADQGRFQFRADLVDPSGKPCLTVNGHTDVDARDPDRPPPQTRLIMPLDEIVFPEPGRYSVRIRVKGHELQGPPLHLLEASPSEPAEA